jgi:hypothetical protein
MSDALLGTVGIPELAGVSGLVLSLLSARLAVA